MEVLRRKVFQELIKYPEDQFNSNLKQIINRSVIFNNQTETIAATRFVAANQPYFRKLG